LPLHKLRCKKTELDSVDDFVGVDVGKGQHHAIAPDKTEKRLLKALVHG
jgi:hypothetical protein